MHTYSYLTNKTINNFSWWTFNLNCGAAYLKGMLIHIFS